MAAVAQDVGSEMMALGKALSGLGPQALYDRLDRILGGRQALSLRRSSDLSGNAHLLLRRGDSGEMMVGYENIHMEWPTFHNLKANGEGIPTNQVRENPGDIFGHAKFRLETADEAVAGVRSTLSSWCNGERLVVA